MPIGMFRGTCEAYLPSEKMDVRGREFYVPEGDFTYDVRNALGWAYIKALESSSDPIVVCLMDEESLRALIPIDKARFINVRGRDGIDELIKTYRQIEPIIPETERIDLNILFRYMEHYQKNKAAGKRDMR